jgi:hypothetical protein
MALITEGCETASLGAEISPFSEWSLRPVIYRHSSENHLPWARVAKPPLCHLPSAVSTAFRLWLWLWLKCIVPA